MSPLLSASTPGLLRRIFSWRSARRALLALALLGTLIAAFYVVENLRGRRAWAATQALIEASGYTLPRTYADLAPPPVPPAENAAEAPVLRAFFDPDPAVASAALARWKTPSKEPLTPALLEPHATSLADLAEALRRPHLRFPVPYEKGYALTVPHVDSLRSAALLLSARARLRLQQGDPVGAADDTETILRLAALLDREGLIISQLVTASIAELGAEAVANGLAQNAWDSAQRARLAAALSGIDLLTGLRQAFLVEWGAASFYLLSLRDRLPDLSPAADETAAGLSRLALIIPSGWWDQARALLGRLYVENVLPAIDPAARRVDLGSLQKVSLELSGKTKRLASGHTFVALISPSHEKLVATQAERQTRLDHARLALALADWREAHGAYPATLAELPPSAGLGNLHDLFTGQPYAYRPAADRSSYRLYAFGPDGHDDGGAPPAKDERNPKDWVWPGGGEGVLGK